MNIDTIHRTVIEAGQELRITCKGDANRNVYTTQAGQDVENIVRRAGADFRQREMRWLIENGGAETDDWLVRLTDQDEPLIEGEEQRPF